MQRYAVLGASAPSGAQLCLQEIVISRAPGWVAGAAETARTGVRPWEGQFQQYKTRAAVNGSEDGFTSTLDKRQNPGKQKHEQAV